MRKIIESNKGDIYNYLTLTGGRKIINKTTHVEYVCRCSKIGWANFLYIRKGVTKSCGCLKKELWKYSVTHGLSKHPLYFIWKGMNQRCYSKNIPKYKQYGARGVTVCEEWRHNFHNFYEWAISNGWESGLELDKDKLSVNGIGYIYSPNYCSFITHKENCSYTKKSIRIDYNGQTRTLSQWCEMYNIPYRQAHRNLCRYNWSIGKILKIEV
jgi:hypothetical protein